MSDDEFIFKRLKEESQEEEIKEEEKKEEEIQEEEKKEDESSEEEDKHTLPWNAMFEKSDV